MEKWAKSLMALGGLVAMIISALSFFPTRKDFEALASNVKQNSEQLNYQSALRTYEFLLKILEKNPRDVELNARC